MFVISHPQIVHLKMYANISNKVHEPEHSHPDVLAHIVGWAIILIYLNSSLTLMSHQLYILSFFQ